MEIIEKDLLTIEEGIIAHQVNCKFVMGSGVALGIRQKWPIVFTQYETIKKFYPVSRMYLGLCQLVTVEQGDAELPKLVVANVFGQDGFNAKGQNAICTDYEAVEKAFERLAAYRQGRQVYIPYKMGCDRARGEWGTYSEIIDRVCPGVIACKLPN